MPAAENAAASATSTSTADGFLLVNLGTPDDPHPPAVRRYLKQFLSDPYVIDIPAPMRFLLLRAVILPFRPKRAAEAYASIWTQRGSPLRFHSEDLVTGLRGKLDQPIELAMRYGNPSIDAGLDALRSAGASRIRVLPLFPQFSESAWETAAQATRKAAAKRGLAVDLVPPFYADQGFIDAVAAVAKPSLDAFAPDHVMMSFHGLPERHVKKTDRSADQTHCLADRSCCAEIVDANRDCYRAHSYATARAIAQALQLSDSDYEVAFQSRLGRTPWIQPYTDERLTALVSEGRRRIAVLCPSFVADCLETLEEIAMRGKEDFVAAGGEDLILVPCVNSSPEWIEAAARLLRA